MTENKPIMIDGVDVSGCNLYFNKCQHKCEGVFDCYKKPNCHFKQLIRKTQECGEALKQLEFVRTHNTVLCSELDQLKAENKQLKKQIESDKGLITSACKQNYQLVQEYDKLKAENEQIKKYLGISSKTIMERLEELQEFRDRDRDKLYQAEQKLERIREIANNYDNCDDVGHYVQDTEARYALEEVAQAMCDISQIIDEVE